jgi:hypothetical protein
MRVRRCNVRLLGGLVTLAMLSTALAGCGSAAIVAGQKFEDHDLLRLVLLEDASETERQCVAASGARSSDGCMAAYLRRDGSVGVVAWLTRSMSVEEYQRAAPVWCESLAMVQGLPKERCGSLRQAAELTPSAQPGAEARSTRAIPVGPVAAGHLLTLVLGGGSSVATSENPVIRVNAEVPSRSSDAAGWNVVAQEWCHSLAHAEWQLIRRDPCHGGADEMSIKLVPVDPPLGWNPPRLPCVGWVNQFCDPTVLIRR